MHTFKHWNHLPRFGSARLRTRNVHCDGLQNKKAKMPNKHVRLWRFSPSAVGGGGRAPGIGAVVSLNRRGVHQPSRTPCRLRHLICGRRCSLQPSRVGAWSRIAEPPFSSAPPMLAAAGAKRHAPFFLRSFPMVIAERGWIASAPPPLRSCGPHGRRWRGMRRDSPRPTPLPSALLQSTGEGRS
jgi:hypothetical protein